MGDDHTDNGIAPVVGNRGDLVGVIRVWFISD